jgi:hypothetical protein
VAPRRTVTGERTRAGHAFERKKWVANGARQGRAARIAHVLRHLHRGASGTTGLLLAKEPGRTDVVRGGASGAGGKLGAARAGPVTPRTGTARRVGGGIQKATRLPDGRDRSDGVVGASLAGFSAATSSEALRSRALVWVRAGGAGRFSRTADAGTRRRGKRGGGICAVRVACAILVEVARAALRARPVEHLATCVAEPDVRRGAAVARCGQARGIARGVEPEPPLLDAGDELVELALAHEKLGDHLGAPHLGTEDVAKDQIVVMRRRTREKARAGGPGIAVIEVVDPTAIVGGSGSAIRRARRRIRRVGTARGEAQDEAAKCRKSDTKSSRSHGLRPAKQGARQGLAQAALPSAIASGYT